MLAATENMRPQTSTRTISATRRGMLVTMLLSTATQSSWTATEIGLKRVLSRATFMSYTQSLGSGLVVLYLSKRSGFC